MKRSEAKVFFKNKFRLSLRQDMVFWLSALIAIAVVGHDMYRNWGWYDSFWQYMELYWPLLGAFIGFSYLATRRFEEAASEKQHHINATLKVLALAILWFFPANFLWAVPAFVAWFLLRTNKKWALQEGALEKRSSPPSKIALFSCICSGLSVPMLIGITWLQEAMISSGLLHRNHLLASPFLIPGQTGMVLAVVGIVLWAISRKKEGRHATNFWAMRLIIVNVILSPFALLWILAFAIGRSK
ncbi:MAG: hypothetical protein FWF59_07580 [Turicibacter sp.]|nr:hypothetical protein [Turicibacter sp.]